LLGPYLLYGEQACFCEEFQFSRRVRHSRGALCEGLPVRVRLSPQRRGILVRQKPLYAGQTLQSLLVDRGSGEQDLQVLILGLAQASLHYQLPRRLVSLRRGGEETE
jgi:hypothetical protein